MDATTMNDTDQKITRKDKGKPYMLRTSTMLRTNSCAPSSPSLFPDPNTPISKAPPAFNDASISIASYEALSGLVHYNLGEIIAKTYRIDISNSILL